MRQKHAWVFGIVLTGFLAAVGYRVVSANHDNPPSGQQVAFAQEVSDLMLNELLAALFKEFDETTAQNVEHGKQAISLIFNDLNRDMRLIGTFGPLQGGQNDRPSGGFEKAALKLALTGEALTGVQRVNDTWFYKRSVPLSNTFHPNCVRCHTNFTPEFFASTDNPGQWVGALVLSVPIKSDDDQK